MAARDLKASMAKGNEIPPAESREEFLEQKKAQEQSQEKAQDQVEEKSEVVQPQPTTPKIPASPVVTAKQTSGEYVKKGYYFLSEANYWYLKDVAQFKDMTVQDYLNHLIAADREANTEILQRLYHNEYYI